MNNHIQKHQSFLKGQLINLYGATPEIDNSRVLDEIEKGKKDKAPVGTIKVFGGRNYIQTATGWKYHGKGTGAKATEHAEGSGHAAFKVSAGHKITTDEGHTGTVKHQDETHTLIEHKTEKGTKVSKVKNEDLESNIKAGKWEHHIPAGEAQDKAKQSAAAASGTGEKKMTESEQMAQEKMKDVGTRFKTFEMMTQAVISGKSKSMIAYGTGGVGKTYTVTQQLEKAGKVAFDEDKMQPAGGGSGGDEGGEEDSDYDYVKITGKATPGAVYRSLYQHNGKIIVFDDCDSVLKNPDAINFFKGALDTSGDGTISYGSFKAPKDEEGNEMPQRFKFKGRVIFISNLSPEEMPQPLKSRGLKIDLSMDKKQTVDRIREIATDKKGQMQNLKFPGIDKYSHEDMKAVIDYLDKNKDHIGDLNTRTVGKVLTMKQMADDIGEGKDWEKYADQEIFSKSESNNFYDGGIMKAKQRMIGGTCGDMIAEKMKKAKVYKSEDVKSNEHKDEDEMIDKAMSSCNVPGREKVVR